MGSSLMHRMLVVTLTRWYPAAASAVEGRASNFGRVIRHVSLVHMSQTVLFSSLEHADNSLHLLISSIGNNTGLLHFPQEGCLCKHLRGQLRGAAVEQRAIINSQTDRSCSLQHVQQQTVLYHNMNKCNRNANRGYD